MERDVGEAVAWYRRAAEQGFVDSQFNLAMVYSTGEDLAPDEAEAAIWFQRAADLGDAEAQFRLGLLYASGSGVERNYIQSYLWAYRAAQKGVVEAEGFLEHLGGEMPEEELAEAKRLALSR